MIRPCQAAGRREVDERRFVPGAIEPWAIYSGDVVTVDRVRRSRRCVALRVRVVEVAVR